MKKKTAEIMCFVILAFLSTNLNAATFQGLGSTAPESLVGASVKYISEDPHNPIWVGQGIYDHVGGEIIDVLYNQSENALFSRTPPTVAWGDNVGALIGIKHNLSGWGAATAISADGSTIVGFDGDGLDVALAFRWTESEGMSYLPSTHGSDEYSLANDVSANGDVIVGWYSYIYGYDILQRAFIWDLENGLQDLNTVLSEQYNIDTGGWILYDAIGISNDGSQIVGYGTNPDGVQEGWIFTIPEPATLVLLAFGGLVLRKRK